MKRTKCTKHILKLNALYNHTKPMNIPIHMHMFAFIFEFVFVFVLVAVGHSVGRTVPLFHTVPQCHSATVRMRNALTKSAMGHVKAPTAAPTNTKSIRCISMTFNAQN